MGAEYLSYVKSIATFSLTFLGYIILIHSGQNDPDYVKFLQA